MHAALLAHHRQTQHLTIALINLQHGQQQHQQQQQQQDSVGNDFTTHWQAAGAFEEVDVQSSMTG
jgi:hypothetical protein